MAYDGCQLQSYPRLVMVGQPSAYRKLLGPDVESLSPVKRALNLVVVLVGHLVDSRLLGD